MILSGFWEASGRYFERILGARIDTKINGFSEGFWKDSRSYVGRMPKATTLDPFENFRANRRLQHFRLVLKFNKNALENTLKILQKALPKSSKNVSIIASKIH